MDEVLRTEKALLIKNGASEEAIDAYIALGYDSLKEFDESYQGHFPSHEEFAYHVAGSLGLVDDDLEWPFNCIDWERAGRALMMDYSEHGGHYFRNL